MDNSGRDGDDSKVLERLGAVVRQRSGADVWRAFLVAQTSARQTMRRRDMTTQKIFLLGQRQRER